MARLDLIAEAADEDSWERMAQSHYTAYTAMVLEDGGWRMMFPAQPTLEVLNYTRYWYDSYGNKAAMETFRNPSDPTTYRDSWTQFSPPAAGGPWILDRPCASGSITPQNGANR